MRWDPVAISCYWRKVSYFDPTKAKDIDVVSMTPKDFELRYGYAPRADVAEKVQITIGDKSYSAICMLGYNGIEAVLKHKGTIYAEKTKQFIDDACAPLIVADVEWGIIDSAQINHTVDVKLSLERCFRGFWTYVPAYYHTP